VSLKSIALVVSSLTAGMCLLIGDFEQADSGLSAFYSQMLSADFSEARRTIDQSIRLWPTNARYYGWRAYLTSQNLPQTCPRGLIGNGHVLTRLDNAAVQEAIKDYQHALELNIRDAVAHHNLAWLEHLLGQDRIAAQNWEAAVTIDPGNAVFRLSYGMFLDERGDKQMAEREYQAAIEIAPSILDSTFFKAYMKRSGSSASSLLRKLIESLETKLQTAKDPILEARLGKLYLFRDDLSRSANLLQDASQQLPNLPLVWLNLGEVFERQGRIVEAMDCYQKARVINGSLAAPYLRIGLVELHSGQKYASAEDLGQAVQRWQRVTPITAAHNNRLYNGPHQRIDDLLPTTLVWYITPCEASSAYRALAKLFPAKREFEARIFTCEQLPSPHFLGN
jgi:tetratricopeptide (TPR) repeat protein